MMKVLMLLVCLGVLTPKARCQPTVELTPVATGLGYLVEIAHANDERLFCLAKNGLIKVIENGSVLPTPFLNINAQVWGSGELGALGLAFDPDYDNNGYFYLHYTANTDQVYNRISRFQVSSMDPNVADPLSEVVLWSFPQPTILHKGGGLEFGPDGYLYFSLGDGGTYETAQDLGNPLGSILRIDVSALNETYAIPPDNPFANAGADTLPEIWAWGLRNPYRFTFDPLTGDVWFGDVGSEYFEEVNIWPAGDNSGPNFGWRCFEGYEPVPDATGCGPASDYVEPIAVHSHFSSWCAVIGGRVYRGTEFPTLYGRYIYTDYCAGEIYSLMPDGMGGWIQEELATGLTFGFTGTGEDHEQELYVCHYSGTLFRVEVQTTVAIDDRQEPEIHVYPVPASDRLVIEGATGKAQHVLLYDRTGGRVMEIPIENVHGRVEVDLSQVANGLYIVVLKNDAGLDIVRQAVPVIR